MKIITPINSIFIFAALSAFFLLPASNADSAESTFRNLPSLLVVQMPLQSAETPPGGFHYVDGCSIHRVNFTAAGATTTNLTSQFISARDPSVSFDGKTIYFAGKKSSTDTWQIYMMEVNGSKIVQITKDKNNHTAPLQAGTLFYLNDTTPIPQLIYSSKIHHNPEIFALFASNKDGAKPRQITHNIFSDSETAVLSNGRLVFSSFSEKKSGYQVAQLMAISIDGTDLMTVTGNQRPFLHQRMAHVGVDNRIYFIETERADELAGGNIAAVSINRPLHSYATLTKSGNYVFPCSLPEGSLIASKRAEDDSYQLVSVKPDGDDELLLQKGGYHILDAQVLAPHQQVRGRSSVVGFRYSDSGVFFCMNIYQSDQEDINNLEPGSVREVLVTEGVISDEFSHIDVSRGSSVAGHGAHPELNYYHRVLGRAKVEKDGSFQIRVPSQIPVTFHLLDKSGKILARQKSWTWVMPGESRGCIGCHEDRELSPPNRFIDAVKKPPQILMPQIEFRPPIAIGDDA